MMKARQPVVLCAIAIICALASMTSALTTPFIRPGRVVAGIKPIHMKQTVTLHMSDEKSAEEGGAKGPAKGEAFYDDEYDSAPKKAGVSDTMKQRLMAEASTGLDADKKQPNVLLYIMGVVGVLVVLGGKGILY